jgi:hypothetical protein
MRIEDGIAYSRFCVCETGQRLREGHLRAHEGYRRNLQRRHGRGFKAINGGKDDDDIPI